MKEYTVAETIPTSAQQELAEFSPLMQTLLYNRGIKTKGEAKQFLYPDYGRDGYDPFLILNMERAVERILQAIDNKERIVIYGDYDCDGIPGSVVLHDFFKKIEYENFSNYIPHRHKEGYGLNIPAIDEIARDGTTLIITVDCGISDVEEVAHANTVGIDVIVTDHHLAQETLPPAYAIVNSKQHDDTYPDDMLCGAGVAFKLVQALLQKRDFGVAPGWEKWLLDMVGLSTIADMVPLQKENRTLAYFGLKVLQKSRRPGLQKLLKKANVNQMHITEDDVGFMIAPRINAASRMDVPIKAFRLLATDNEVVADELARHLHKINDERKWIVASMVKEIKKTLAQRELGDVIVIGNPKWKVGVLGLAASRIVEDYGKTAFVWGREGSEVIKGSCRSDGTVNVVDLMVSVSQEVFIDVGGHEGAGGFSVSHEKVHTLEEELLAAYEKVEKFEGGAGKINVDSEMSLGEVTWETYRDIELLAPFGVGNPKPTFLFRKAKITKVKKFGKELNHLELIFDDGARGVTAIGFFVGDESFPGATIEEGVSVDLVATLEKSMFRNYPQLRLRIVDIAPVRKRVSKKKK